MEHNASAPPAYYPGAPVGPAYPPPHAYPAYPPPQPQVHGYPQPPPPIPAPAPANTTSNNNQNTVVINTTTQPVVAPILVGGCPRCHAGSMQDHYGLCAICLAICCFPLGILCCLVMKEKKCSNCGSTF